MVLTRLIQVWEVKTSCCACIPSLSPNFRSELSRRRRGLAHLKALVNSRICMDAPLVPQNGIPESRHK